MLSKNIFLGQNGEKRDHEWPFFGSIGHASEDADASENANAELVDDDSIRDASKVGRDVSVRAEQTCTEEGLPRPERLHPDPDQQVHLKLFPS